MTDYTTHDGPIDGSMVEYRELLIDLDCLLDTRVAVVALEDQEKALSILLDEQYRFRKRDNVYFQQYLPDWKEKWKTRHLPILDDKISKILTQVHTTMLTSYLLNYIYEQTTLQIDRPTTLEMMRIAINVYPYHLDAIERASLKEIIDEQFPHIKEIRVVSIPTETLTPAYIRRYFDSYWTYDLKHWSETHSKAFEETLHPNTRIFAPKLIYDEKADESVMTDHMKEIINSETFFEELQGITSLWFDLNLIDVGYYCVPEPAVIRERYREAKKESQANSE